jgi:hypothetical protein
MNNENTDLTGENNMQRLSNANALMTLLSGIFQNTVSASNTYIYSMGLDDFGELLGESDSNANGNDNTNFDDDEWNAADIELQSVENFLNGSDSDPQNIQTMTFVGENGSIQNGFSFNILGFNSEGAANNMSGGGTQSGQTSEHLLRMALQDVLQSSIRKTPESFVEDFFTSQFPNGECSEFKAIAYHAYSLNYSAMMRCIKKQLLESTREGEFVLENPLVQKFLVRLLLKIIGTKPFIIDTNEAFVDIDLQISVILKKIWVLLIPGSRHILYSAMASSMYNRLHTFPLWLLGRETIEQYDAIEFILLGLQLSFLDNNANCFSQYLHFLYHYDYQLSSDQITLITKVCISRFDPIMFEEWIQYLLACSSIDVAVLDDIILQCIRDITHYKLDRYSLFSMPREPEERLKTATNLIQKVLDGDGEDSLFSLPGYSLDSFTVFSDSIGKVLLWRISFNRSTSSAFLKRFDVNSFARIIYITNTNVLAHILNTCPDLLDNNHELATKIKQLCIGYRFSMKMFYWLYENYFSKREDFIEIRCADLYSLACSTLTDVGIHTMSEILRMTFFIIHGNDTPEMPPLDFLEDGGAYVLNLISHSENEEVPKAVIASQPAILQIIASKMRDCHEPRFKISYDNVADLVQKMIQTAYNINGSSAGLRPHPIYLKPMSMSMSLDLPDHALMNSDESDKMCPICLSEETNDEPWVKLPCCFIQESPKYTHFSCLTTWLLEHSSCPRCRKSITLLDMIDITLPDDVDLDQIMFKTKDMNAVTFSFFN